MSPLVAQLSLLAAVAAFAVAAASDLRRYVIPDTCSLVPLAAFCAFAATGATAGAWPLHLAMGVLVFLAGAGLFAAGVLGGGDVKLFAAGAVWAGIDLFGAYALVMALAGLLVVAAVAARVLLQRRAAPADGEADGSVPLARQPVPYGIAIAAGAVFVLAHRAGVFA
jgi:prepilin peptidase CpaA